MFCSQILVWSIAMDVFSLAFLRMDVLRRRRRIVRKIFFCCPSSLWGGMEFEGRMYSWMERLDGRGRGGRREENKLVFDRKLKIVEIFSADVEKSVGRVLPLFFSRRLPCFSCPSVNLLLLFPEMQSSYRRIVVKGIGKSIFLLQNIPQGQTWTV